MPIAVDSTTPVNQLLHSLRHLHQDIVAHRHEYEAYNDDDATDTNLFSDDMTDILGNINFIDYAFKSYKHRFSKKTLAQLDYLKSLFQKYETSNIEAIDLLKTQVEKNLAEECMLIPGARVHYVDAPTPFNESTFQEHIRTQVTALLPSLDTRLDNSDLRIGAAHPTELIATPSLIPSLQRACIAKLENGSLFVMQQLEKAGTQFTLCKSSIKDTSQQLRKEFWRLWDTNVTIPNTELFNTVISMVEAFKRLNGDDTPIHIYKDSSNPLAVEALILYCQATGTSYVNHTNFCEDQKLLNKRASVVKDLLANNENFRKQTGYDLIEHIQQLGKDGGKLIDHQLQTNEPSSPLAPR